MRDSFVQTLYDLAAQDPQLMLLVGDLGFSIFDDFRRDFPKQFLNVGIAEQNLIGLATGMALEGKRVFAYSIGNFPTLRPLEQIRNDVCYHEAAVTVVTAGAGLCYGALGASHHATEDIACLRALPNLTILAPGDPREAVWATRFAHSCGGPCYLRLGRAGEPMVHTSEDAMDIDKLQHVSGEGEVALLSTGGILHEASLAVRLLDEQGIPTALYSVPTVKPLDQKGLEELARRFKLLVTVEEHSMTGGLGGAVAEVLAQMPGEKARLLINGLANTFVRQIGDQKYLRKAYQLDAESLAQNAAQACRQI